MGHCIVLLEAPGWQHLRLSAHACHVPYAATLHVALLSTWMLRLGPVEASRPCSPRLLCQPHNRNFSVPLSNLATSSGEPDFSEPFEEPMGSSIISAPSKTRSRRFYREHSAPWRAVTSCLDSQKSQIKRNNLN